MSLAPSQVTLLKRQTVGRIGKTSGRIEKNKTKVMYAEVERKELQEIDEREKANRS